MNATSPSRPAVIPGTDTISVAAVGAGHVFTWYRRALERRDDARLVAVVDPRGDARAGRLPRLPSIQDLLDSRLAVDAVLVLTPAETHVEIATTALRGGLHVLVEKPVALDVAGIEALATAARESRMVCCPGHTYVYEPEVEQAQALLAEGALGKVGFCRVTYLKVHDEDMSLRYPPLLHQHGIHLLYLLLHLFGRPTEVTARLSQVVYATPGLHDQAALTLGWDDGLLAQVSLAIGVDPRGNAAGLVGWEIYGGRGSIVHSWHDAVYAADGALVSASYPATFERLLDRFLACCRSAAVAPASTLLDARDAECIRAAAVRSHEQGATVGIDYA